MARLPTVLADRIAHAARSRGIDPERAGDLAGLLDALAAGARPPPGPGGLPAAAVLAAGAVVAQLFSYDRSLSTDPGGAASDPGAAADRWI